MIKHNNIGFCPYPAHLYFLLLELGKRLDIGKNGSPKQSDQYGQHICWIMSGVNQEDGMNAGIV